MPDALTVATPAGLSPNLLGQRQRLQLHLAAWALTGMLVAVLLYALIGTPWIAALVFAVPLGLAAAPISLSAWYLSRALPLNSLSALRVVATACGAALVTSFVWAALGRLWWLGLKRMALQLDMGPENGTAVAALLVTVGALAYLISVAIHYIWGTIESAATNERRVLESEIAAREAELRALRAQIDPHFLFNSLNSISGLVGVDPEGARNMCQRLGDFLRNSLTLGGAGRIPLHRELALVRQYLEIEQVRFGARLRVTATTTPEAGEVMVPALLLQPLAENAVRHGIATRLEGGTVSISAERLGPKVVIEVRNERDPDARSRKGTGLGLEIVRRRLAAAFGAEAALSVEIGEGSYRVLVTIPGASGQEGSHERS
jgi:two-component system sensor histidine kinase AlgZ